MNTPSPEQNCILCNMPIAIRNPSGNCDHLYYPEHLDPDDLVKSLAKERKRVEELERQISDLTFYETKIKELESELKKAQEENERLKSEILRAYTKGFSANKVLLFEAEKLLNRAYKNYNGYVETAIKNFLKKLRG